MSPCWRHAPARRACIQNRRLPLPGKATVELDTIHRPLVIIVTGAPPLKYLRTWSLRPGATGTKPTRNAVEEKCIDTHPSNHVQGMLSFVCRDHCVNNCAVCATILVRRLARSQTLLCPRRASAWAPPSDSCTHPNPDLVDVTAGQHTATVVTFRLGHPSLSVMRGMGSVASIFNHRIGETLGHLLPEEFLKTMMMTTMPSKERRIASNHKNGHALYT